MVLPHDRRTWISTLPAAAPRLTLRQNSSTATMLDGTWPRSRITVPELTNLIIALDSRDVAATRVMLNPEAWDEQPRRISINGRIVRVGWFTTLDTHLLIATTGTDQRIDLLVVPPALSADRAAAATTMATDGDPTLRASAIMSAISTQAPTRPHEPGLRDTEESEPGQINGHRPGGSVRPAHVPVK